MTVGGSKPKKRAKQVMSLAATFLVVGAVAAVMVARDTGSESSRADPIEQETDTINTEALLNPPDSTTRAPFPHIG